MSNVMRAVGVWVFLCVAPIAAATPGSPAGAHGATPGGALAPDASIDQVLDALDALGDRLQTLSADVEKVEIDADLGEDPANADARLGKVVYQRLDDGDIRIRASFDQVRSGGKVRPDRVEYLLQGGELIDRNYRGRSEVRRVVRRPGERIDLFRLGKGPFPLPIGQAKDDVHAEFEVTRAPAAGGESGADAPPDTIHLRLTPRAETELARDFSSIDVWVHRSDHLPRRVETLSATGAKLIRTDLRNVRLNAPLSDADFSLEKVDESRWNISRE